MEFSLEYNNVIEKKEIKTENYTINDLLKELDLTPTTIVAKQNDKITIDSSKINNGDKIKLIRIIHGG